MERGEQRGTAGLWSVGQCCMWWRGWLPSCPCLTCLPGLAWPGRPACLQGVSVSQLDVRDVIWREDLGGEQLELGA